MALSRYMFVLKLLIVAAFSYSAYRLLLSPNEHKDLHLSVWIITSILATLLTIFDRQKRKY